MASFTPEQINEIMEEFLEDRRTYVGARYVPIFGRKDESSIEWDDSTPYEPLTIVTWHGNSYTSRRHVPSGIPITDSSYWAMTGAYNAQIADALTRLDEYDTIIRDTIEATRDVANALPSTFFTSENTVKGYVDTTATDMAEATTAEIGDMADGLREELVPLPVFPESLHGTLGQVLQTLGNGQTKWVNPVIPDAEDVDAAVTEWLNDHPEATTTVQNGSITLAKLDNTFAKTLFRASSLTTSTETEEIYNSMASNIDRNTIYYTNPNLWNDIPSIGVGWLITFIPSATAYNRLQYFITHGYNVVYYRYTTSGASGYHDWRLLFDPTADQSTKVDAVTSIDALAGYSGLWHVAATDTPTGAPSQLAGSEYSVLSMCTRTANYMQVCFAADGRTYTRFWETNAWGDWVVSGVTDGTLTLDAFNAANYNKFIKYEVMNQSKFTTDFHGNLSELYTNTTVWLQTSWCNDAPASLTGRGIFVLTYGPTSQTSWRVQFVYDVSNHALFSRVKSASGTFSDWNVLAPYDIKNREARLFAWGDSIVRGQVRANVFSDNNYPAMIGKLLGMKVTNLAIGGTGIYADWDSIHEQAIDSPLLDFSDAKLLIVGYGTYNENTLSTIPLGTYTDTTLDSFIGYYYNFMKDVQEKAPNATLVYVSGFGATGTNMLNGRQFSQSRTFEDGSHTWGEVYDEIERMCNLHGWACINQHHCGSPFNQWNMSTSNEYPLIDATGGHPNDRGYEIYGNGIAARVAAIYANMKGDTHVSR